MAESGPRVPAPLHALLLGHRLRASALSALSPTPAPPPFAGRSAPSALLPTGSLPEIWKPHWPISEQGRDPASVPASPFSSLLLLLSPVSWSPVPCCAEQRTGTKARWSPGVPGQPVEPGNKRLLVEQWRGLFHSTTGSGGCSQWPQGMGEGCAFGEVMGSLRKAKGFENSLGYMICCHSQRGGC